MKIHEYAGKHLPEDKITDIDKLIKMYYSEKPDMSAPENRVSFGTSGHRGSSFKSSFTESHILAITQAICDYRKKENITGPVFIGYDTHALSRPAFETALEVLAANETDAMIADNDYTPTPSVSHAIISYNSGRISGLADGIVITPSHNPPSDGGFKYNTINGGPADISITSQIQDAANSYLENNLNGVKRVPFNQALIASTTHTYEYRHNYVRDLCNVLDMESIRASGIILGADPLGGSGISYWGEIADFYKINLEIVSNEVDKSFKFMTADWDGKIRMDPSSKYAMQRLLSIKDKFEVSFGCDPDYDRHGIVTKTHGLMQPNHYLSAAIDYLFRHRAGWKVTAGVGKTLVSSSMIDRVARGLNRNLAEVPVGFKWFVSGLIDGSLGFGGEESAGASFLRFDGKPWSTDKDGIILALLSGEITAKTKLNPSQYYDKLTEKYGKPCYARHDAPCSPELKKMLKSLSPEKVTFKELAGSKITKIETKASSNNAAFGGVKISSENGWFAARPSGTENVYKIYAESFKDESHLNEIFSNAENMIASLEK
ncbi:MAG: phosphoglucomutase (alpha-D-glucose-1,6-bisphosphate-dependent) [Elusimicrobiales bacterium]|nr:phosphoglucomutase (alpha-D-glucose-1,6-bisphosphate-dependent) [Elusimicrobiales bacterium]